MNDHDLFELFVVETVTLTGAMLFLLASVYYFGAITRILCLPVTLIVVFIFVKYVNWKVPKPDEN